MMSRGARGTDPVSNKFRVAFLTLAKDCGPTLSRNLKAIEKICRNGFPGSAVFVGEDGSRDNTREVARRNYLMPVNLVDTETALEGRPAEKLAVKRQRLLTEARGGGSFDFAVVFDSDEPFLETVTGAELTSSFRQLLLDKEIFAISAMTKPRFYDLLSYVNEDQNFAWLAHDLENLTPFGVLSDVRLRKKIKRCQRLIQPNLRCDSSFNGLTIYPAPDYFKGSYNFENSLDWLNEHISLHKSIAQGRHILISDTLTTMAPREHLRSSLFQILTTRFQNFFAGRCRALNRFRISGRDNP